MIGVTEMIPAWPAGGIQRRVLLIMIAIAVLAVGRYLYLRYDLERDMRDAIAEADRLDPGWRLEDLEDARIPIADARNSGPIAQAAIALVPPSWQKMVLAHGACLHVRLAELPPPQFLEDGEIKVLRAELMKAAPAVAKARSLADFPDGRYSITWKEDWYGTLLPHLQPLRLLVDLLAGDVALRCRDGDVDGAMRSCRAALNVGRSIGDEPSFVSQNVRASIGKIVIRILERALASGCASDRELRSMQDLLTVEDSEPSLLRALRGERVGSQRALQILSAGSFDRKGYQITGSQFGPIADQVLDRHKAPAYRAANLRWYTSVVEIVKLPPEAQEERLRKLPTPEKTLFTLLDPKAKNPDWVQSARTFNRLHAELRCAIVGIAAERFRLQTHRWPERPDELVPQYLSAVPADPFDGRPLRFRRLQQGIAIYSVGPDRSDDGGRIDREEPDHSPANYGFQLWNEPGARAGSAAGPPP